MAEYKDVAAIKTKIQKICDNCWHPYRLGGCPEHCGINDALKAIDSVPPAQSDGTDINVGGMISRQAAVDALGERPTVWTDDDDYALGERNQYDMDRLAIETVPPAQPVNISKLQPNCNQVASDCISRAAAVDAIDEIESEVEDGYGFQYAKWREFFCNLPSTQPDLDEWCTDCKEYDKERYSCPRWNRVIRQTLDDVGQERWIPCKTRKPEKSGLYLVTKQQKTGEIQLATAHYNTAFDEWSGNGNFKKVLAWQPLPSPWRGGQDGN